MADTTGTLARTPWHLWVVGAVSLLWNAIGAMDFTMTQLKNEAYLQGFTDEQRAYFFSIPFPIVLVWGVATWGSLLGSLLLLLRRRAANAALVASLVGAVVTFVYNYGFSDGLKVMGDKATGALVFCVIIVAISVLLLLYARRMTGRGVLR